MISTRAASAAFRPLRTSALQRISLSSSRRYSSGQQPPSPTANFYKTFTRPVAKCLLTALFTYQLVYWGWAKLENDEIKENRQAEIAQLEDEVRRIHQEQQQQRQQEREQQEQEQKKEVKKKGWW